MAEQYHKLERTENVERNVAFGLLNKTLALVLPFIVRTVLIYRLALSIWVLTVCSHRSCRSYLLLSWALARR